MRTPWACACSRVRCSSRAGQRALQRQTQLVAQRLRVVAQMRVGAFDAVPAQHRGTEAGAAAAQRQVPVRQLLVAAGAGPERLPLAQAVPQPGELIGVGLADPQRGGVVVAGRRAVLQHQQGHRAAGELGQRGVQGAHLGQRIDRVAQRVAPGAQLLGLQRVPLGQAGLPALRGHQRGDDRVHDQHRAQQQRMLAQVDGEGAARRHERPVEGQHGHACSTPARPRPAATATPRPN